MLFVKPLQAQYDSLLHKSYGEGVYGIHNLYSELINIKDSTIREQKAIEIIKFAKSHNDLSLERNVAFFLIFWKAFYENQPQEISLKSLQKLLEQSSKENIQFLKVRSLRALAEFYWKIQKNYELAFVQYLLLDGELKNISPFDYPEAARDYMQIGSAYFYFKDYPLAIIYFKRAISLPENSFNTMVVCEAKNNLGLSYLYLNKLDSANFYFKTIFETKFPQANVWKRIAKGNIGQIFYLQKKYNQAIPLLESNFEEASKVGDYGDAAGASVTLASIYTEKNEFSKAKLYIDKAQQFIFKSEQTDRLRLLYPVMSKWYMATGRPKLGQAYLDSSIITINQYNRKYSALNILRAQQKIDNQQKELQLAAFSLEKAQNISERNVLIFIIVMIGAFFLITYFLHKKKQAHKELKLNMARNELELSHTKLSSYMDNILEKNKLIEQFESRRNEEDKIEVIQQLQQCVILTEEDWISFQRLFEMAYPSLLFRFKENYPTLTEGELRYFLLTKLKLNTKEMAVILGVSANAVQVMRHRIRKKLNLTDADSLDNLIQGI